MGARPLFSLSLPAKPAWPALRRWLLLALAAVVALAAAYLLWLRDSSLVAVTDVTVIGAERDPGIEADLAHAAMSMSTLDVDESALRAAVADDPAVVSVSASPDFPHGLSVTVDVREPAGYIAADGGVIVAGDGVVLATETERPEGLPPIEVESPEVDARASGSALALARVLGPAPDALSRRIERGFEDPELGPVVVLTSGIELRFGDPAQAASKWDAAAAVLADPELGSASYLDLSVPSRPVAG